MNAHRTLRGLAIRGFAAAAALVAFASASPRLDARESSKATEYEVKAAFLFNFTQYTDWPADAFAGPDAPFVVGVLGADRFEGALERTLKDKKAAGRSIVVERYQRLSQIGAPHLLFVCERDPALAAAVPKAFANRPILLVGDCEEFAAVGGSVGLFLERAHVNFAINPAALERSRLSVSARVMKLARIVKER